jgi:hypothetical protein
MLTLPTSNGRLLPRAWRFSQQEGEKCSVAQQFIILTEIKNAQAMAKYTSEHLTDYDFHETFFSSAVRAAPDYKDNTAAAFARIASMLELDGKDYDFTITCNPLNSFCLKKPVPFYASMNDGVKRMNFCPNFFKDNDGIAPTQLRLDSCKDPAFDLRAAQRSRAAVIIHECTHTKFAMPGTRR